MPPLGPLPTSRAKTLAPQLLAVFTASAHTSLGVPGLKTEAALPKVMPPSQQQPTISVHLVQIPTALVLKAQPSSSHRTGFGLCYNYCIASATSPLPGFPPSLHAGHAPGLLLQ